MAAALAQALNCEAPVEGAAPIHVDACGQCRSCKRFSRVLEQMRGGTDVALDCFVRIVPDNKLATVNRMRRVQRTVLEAEFRKREAYRAIEQLDATRGRSLQPR